MVLQIFPEPSASSINADSYTVPTALRQYKVVKNFDAAVYTITTSPNNSQATVKFLTSSGILSTTTISGTVTYNLASSATSAFIEVSSSTDVVVTISKIASALSGSGISGTLDTITSTQTYNETGPLYVFVVGGGAGGGTGNGGTAQGTAGGSGGGAGSISQGLFYLNTSTSITIGSAGNPDSNGGTTNFGNLLSAGGGSVGGTGAGNGNNPWNTAQSSSNPGSAISNPYSSISIGTNGGGGAGSAYSPGAGGGGGGGGGAGAGSGIGTGGTGGNSGAGPTANTGSAATGYGAGGGGGGGATNGGNGGSGTGTRSGGAGSPGVVYVLRGF